MSGYGDVKSWHREIILKDLGDKLPADAKSRLESAASDVEAAVKSGSMAEIKAKTEALNAVWNEASSKLYESARAQQPPPEAGPQQGPPGGPQGGQSGDGGKKVENADFEVVDDK